MLCCYSLFVDRCCCSQNCNIMALKNWVPNGVTWRKDCVKARSVSCLSRVSTYVLWRIIDISISWHMPSVDDVVVVESVPYKRMAGAVIGGVVEMANFQIENLINLMKALLNVNRKIGIGLKNKTPVNYTLAMELHCSTVRHTWRLSNMRHCVETGFLDWSAGTCWWQGVMHEHVRLY